ncbi:MAG: DNA recombination protein RmuC [Coriobacteriia bacterium]|nr:DNA recombination protein RmuC [Coriobacteriia bacterium]
MATIIPVITLLVTLLIGVALLVLIISGRKKEAARGSDREKLEADMQQMTTELRRDIAVQLSAQAQQNEQKLENIRQTLDTKLDAVRVSTEEKITALTQDNAKQLDRMRETVDEKLQKTLEERLGQSFALVSRQLEQVNKGLGEMQTLASGVGDLKKVLSNVKTRGILGEIQLGAILKEILAPEQYVEDFAIKPGSADRVEYALKMPGEGEGDVYLPIDAKFPTDRYSAVLDAYESGDPVTIEAAKKDLDTFIKQSARSIHDKYIDPPHTTDFGILFLPMEGLYAEVIARGLLEELQAKYQIVITGPSTMAAFVNSLQMGFRTLAIQKRSQEVWAVLGRVKKEFANFSTVLATTRKRLHQADDELDKLVGTRTNQINRALRQVESLEATDVAGMIEAAEVVDVPDEDGRGDEAAGSDNDDDSDEAMAPGSDDGAYPYGSVN